MWSLIDTNSDFDYHFSYLSSKVSKSVRVLCKLKSYVTSSYLQQFYYTKVYPYLVYCIIVLGATYSVHLKPLTTLQTRVGRKITNSYFHSRTDPAFRRLEILILCDYTIDNKWQNMLMIIGYAIILFSAKIMNTVCDQQTNFFIVFN